MSVDQVSVPIDSAIQVGPLAPDFQVGLVHIPAGTRTTPLPAAPLAELVAHDRQQLGFPVPDRLVAYLDAPQEQDLAQVSQGQAVA